MSGKAGRKLIAFTFENEMLDDGKALNCHRLPAPWHQVQKSIFQYVYE
jgi:hypothetical protein